MTRWPVIALRVIVVALWVYVVAVAIIQDGPATMERFEAYDDH